ncbi:MAG: M61 family peptidase [Sphingomonas adhaesiva]|uniref:M61 family metallopeptidase n=1 Tax=Sphingomonas adhaesiva TaxID=28212 RepID=UPI002FFBB599
MRATIGAWLLLGLGLGLAPAAGTAAQAQGTPPPPVRYEVAFPDPAHHLARVTATWRGVPAGPLRVQMSRSSPGRYALHEFAKNVFDVQAVDGAGRALAVTRSDPYGWSVAGHDGTVRVTYSLYGDRGDGTYAQIDATHAHLNMPATLMWATGYDAAPVEVGFAPADPSWKIATQLIAVPGAPHRYRARDLQYLMDSPVELSDHMVREWKIGDQTMRIAAHHPGSAAQMDQLATQVQKLVPQHAALFGEWPRFDGGSYTFIADYVPQISGDGMEHRNSTIVTTPTPLGGDNAAQLGTISHEFIHAWNVERMRPAELEPFDFSRANATPSLWLAEGFTSYYGPLMLRRAGLSDVDAFLAEMSEQYDGILRSPARAFAGPQEASIRAPLADAATSIDPVAPQARISYYPYGAVVGMLLDLSIRQRFPTLTLDDYMRHLWRTFGRTETPYRPDDLRRALAQVTGDAAFADAFFARSIAGHELPDAAPLLAQAGLVARPANPGRAWIGAPKASAIAGGVVLAAAPAVGSPLYAAGADKGDRPVLLGDAAIATAADWEAALARLTPGARVPVRFVQRGRERQAVLTVATDPAVAIVRMETAGQTPTAAQRAFRERWLGR